MYYYQRDNEVYQKVTSFPYGEKTDASSGAMSMLANNDTSGHSVLILYKTVIMVSQIYLITGLDNLRTDVV